MIKKSKLSTKKGPTTKALGIEQKFPENEGIEALLAVNGRIFSSTSTARAPSSDNSEKFVKRTNTSPGPVKNRPKSSRLFDNNQETIDESLL